MIFLKKIKEYRLKILTNVKIKVSYFSFEKLKNKFYSAKVSTSADQQVPAQSSSKPENPGVNTLTPAEQRANFASIFYYRGALSDLPVSEGSEPGVLLKDKIKRLKDLIEDISNNPNLTAHKKQELLEQANTFLQDNKKKLEAIPQELPITDNSKRYYYEGILQVLEDPEIIKTTTMADKIQNIRTRLMQETDITTLDKILLDAKFQIYSEKLSNPVLADPAKVNGETDLQTLQAAYQTLTEQNRELSVANDLAKLDQEAYQRLKDRFSNLEKEYNKLYIQNKENPLIVKNAELVQQLKQFTEEITEMKTNNENLRKRNEHLLKETEELGKRIETQNKEMVTLEKLAKEKATITPITYITDKEKESIISLLLDVTKKHETFHVNLLAINKDFENVILLQESHKTSLTTQQKILRTLKHKFSEYKALHDKPYDQIMLNYDKEMNQRCRVDAEIKQLFEALKITAKDINENLTIFKTYTDELSTKVASNIESSSSIVNKNITVFETITGKKFESGEELMQFIYNNNKHTITEIEKVKHSIFSRATQPFKVTNLSQQIPRIVNPLEPIPKGNLENPPDLQVD